MDMRVVVAGSRGVTRALADCATACEQALGAYAARARQADVELRQLLILALAAMRVASVRDLLDDARDDALKLVCVTSREAAAACLRCGIDPALIQFAVACDHARGICEDALAG